MISGLYHSSVDCYSQDIDLRSEGSGGLCLRVSTAGSEWKEKQKGES